MGSTSTRQPQGKRHIAQQGGGIGRPDDDLPAVAALYPAEETGRRTDQVGRQAQAADLGFEPAAQAASLGLAAAGILMTVPQGDQAAEGRVVEAAAIGQFALEEGGVVVARGCLDCIVLGVVGLHDNAPPAMAAPGSPGYLSQQLEGALGSPEIGQMEGRIGRGDANQGDQGQIKPLGDHLRANQHDRPGDR